MCLWPDRDRIAAKLCGLTKVSSYGSGKRRAVILGRAYTAKPPCGMQTGGFALAPKIMPGAFGETAIVGAVGTDNAERSSLGPTRQAYTRASRLGTG